MSLALFHAVLRRFPGAKERGDRKARRRESRCPEELYVDEARLRDQLDLIPYRDRAGHSVGPCVQASDDFRREVLLQNDVGELQSAARSEHSVNLAVGVLFQR